MDKIIIKNLLLRGILGINPDERVNKQDILINLTAETDIRPAAGSDNIEQAVNYKFLAQKIIEHVEHSSNFLVEKLVTDLAKLVFAEFPAVQKVTVRVEKTSVLRFAESVGIEIERTRADFAGESHHV